MIGSERRYVIMFGCPDRAGIVARIASFLADAGGWIVEAAYHTDPDTGWFFTRQVVLAESLPFGIEELRERFRAVSAQLGGTGGGRISDTGRRSRVAILVSREGHCLYDLLGRTASGELAVDVSAVIGNHPDLAEVTRAHRIPFHHVPFPAGDPEGNVAAFAQLRQLVEAGRPDAVVLARFMQILPPQLCAAWSGRALNIHHSFLPSFAGGWIVEAAYHTDPDTGWFFTRQVVLAESLPFGIEELRERFRAVSAQLGGTGGGRISDTGRRSRVAILVSREGHCLYDLLGRTASGELAVDVSAVIGNHPDLAEVTRAHRIPFHHVPFPAGDPEGNVAAFAQLRQLVEAGRPDAVVLARFMQILPPQLCAAWSGRALNIHHSFLPSFAGARPYHRAHQRGVKLIGATCHYVTAELDAGPIIEQDVIRVGHGDSVADLVRKGRDIEKVVLARGLRWHLESRILVHGNKTVVFQ